jgi:predicted MFS family arabinose efflux permease
VEGQPNRLESLRTLRAANLDGAFATAFITLVGGSFIVGYLKEINAADIWLGLLTAIPAICGLAQIPGSVWGRSFVSFKKYVAPGGLIWRLLHIPLCLLPLIALNANSKLTIILIFSGIASLVVNMVNPIYGDWLARLVPDSQRGAFYGKRNSLNAAIGTGTGLLGGLLVDTLKRANLGEKSYSAVFVLGLILSFVSMHFFMQMADVQREEPIKANVQETVNALVSPFKNKQFVRVILFLFVFIAGQSFAGNLWAAYAFETLQFDQTQVQFLGLFHAVGNISMSKFWGFLSDKYGNKPILGLVGMGMLLTPTAWLFTQPGAENMNFNMGLLYSTHILMGGVFSGVALCQYNIIFSTSPPAERSTYLGSAMAIQSIAGAVPPLLGAAMLSFFRTGHDADLAYKFTFICAVAIRFVALLLLIPVREEGSRSFRETMGNLKSVTPKGLRAMKTFTRSGDAEEREHAIQKIAGQGFALASDELIKALHDPSPRVRRQAAAGRLGDQAAVQDLIHQLREHPDLVEEETVEALGDLGDPAAISELIKVLDAPRSVLRRAAARAIAQLPGAGEDRAAVDALIQAAENPSDPDLRRSALQALRNLEAPGIAATISHALTDKHPSVRIAAAEAAGELELKQTADACRASLVLYDDEGCAEVAYALGVNGTLEDVPRILEVAKSCVSMTTRRRCLLGVARVYGVESQTYRALMSTGMERDQLMITLLTIGGKRSKHANQALEAHGNGDEVNAIKALSLGKDAAILTDFDLPELFVVAAVVYSERMSNRTGR